MFHRPRQQAMQQEGMAISPCAAGLCSFVCSSTPIEAAWKDEASGLLPPFSGAKSSQGLLFSEAREPSVAQIGAFNKRCDRRLLLVRANPRMHQTVGAPPWQRPHGAPMPLKPPCLGLGFSRRALSMLQI